MTIMDGESRVVMAASDVVLLASGTAAMEAMLLKRPMVVAYKLSGLTYWILKAFNMLKVVEYSLPNLLAGKSLVKECMQHEATPEKMASAMQELLDKIDNNEDLINAFANIHIKLAKNSSEQAADAVISMLQGNN